MPGFLPQLARPEKLHQARIPGDAVFGRLHTLAKGIRSVFCTKSFSAQEILRIRTQNQKQAFSLLDTYDVLNKNDGREENERGGAPTQPPRVQRQNEKKPSRMKRGGGEGGRVTASGPQKIKPR